MTLVPTPTPATHRFVRFYVDGGVLEANPSPVGVYWSVRVENDGAAHVTRHGSRAYTTNNEAEWLALREALVIASARYSTMPVVVYSDSDLIVKQFNGLYAVREPRMRALWTECRELAARLAFVSVQAPERRCPACDAVIGNPRARRCPACRAALPPGWRPREVMLEKLGH